MVIEFVPGKKNGKMCFVLHRNPFTMKEFKSKRMFRRFSYCQHGWKVSPRRLDWTQSVSALHLVCKPISTEYLSFLYSRVQFSFEAPNWMYSFCSVSSKMGLHYTRKVKLHICTHGAPEAMMHAPYVGKHYDSWNRAINKLIEAMPNIEHVEVSLRVKEAPLAFTFREPWAEMVLQLRGLKHLKSATVSLWSPKVKKHWSWDDPSVELQSPMWVELATGLHDAFASALALRILGKSERQAVWKYRLLVDKGLAATKGGVSLHRRVMGIVWVDEAQHWEWVAKE
jgi:hypothetical protein